ncbi:MAG: Rpn family recombination-promoting nuclease/putative transposase [Treponema sp.]
MSKGRENRTYKDSVFVDLFSTDEKAKERFLSLYNALHQTQLPPYCPVEQLKLDNVMYRGLSNDVSCLVDNKIIVLAEHQSTINENMPLRCLEYIARLYEHILAPTARYHRTLQKIPAPEFYVFYNGIESYPVNKILKLSDAFITKPAPIPLELTVEVVNINKDKENRILKSCKALDEYSLFFEEVRIQKQLDPENGFTNAVKICIQKGILKEYLQRKSKEVINMLIAEYDYETDIAVQRAEEREIAFADGVRKTTLKTATALRSMGFDISQIMQATGLTQDEIEQLPLHGETE